MISIKMVAGVGTVLFLLHLLGKEHQEVKRLTFRNKFYEDSIGTLAGLTSEEAIEQWLVEMDKDVEFYKIVSHLPKEK